MGEKVVVKDRWFRDELDRIHFFRGVNLSGNAKLPFTPYMPSHIKEKFYDHANISFVGRPFPLIEADEHFKRLKSLGYNFLRFCVTWEALEHKGPGQYDLPYIDYVIAVLKKAKEYKFKVLIDPHQDCWSRFSGGSGAPGWTFEIVGIVVENIPKCGAALMRNDDKEYVPMMWPSNNYLFAGMTMATLFYAGKTFAPRCTINGQNVQDFLQDHFCKAFQFLAQNIENAGLHQNTVIGYETMNEPSSGFIGIPDLGVIPDHQEFRFGSVPTPFEGMLLASGETVKVQKWNMTRLGPLKIGAEILNEEKCSLWKHGAMDIWKEHRIWEENRLLIPDYFVKNPQTGKIIDFMVDFWKPHVKHFASAITAIVPHTILFVQPPVNEPPPVWTPDDVPCRIVYAPHWYDGYTLLLKKFYPWNYDYVGVKRGIYSWKLGPLSLGYTQVSTQFKQQLAMIKNEGLERFGNIPILLGEFGIPFDMDDKKAFADGDYSNQILALDANYQAVEQNLLNCTIWNYTSDNNNRYGDNWNDEDTSIFSVDGGFRAMPALARPFPLYVNGTPLEYSFNLSTKTFKLLVEKPIEDHATGPTEIFLPETHFDLAKLHVEVSEGLYRLNLHKRTLCWTYSASMSIQKWIVISDNHVDLKISSFANLCKMQ